MERSEAFMLLKDSDLIYGQDFIEAAIDRIALELAERVGGSMPIMLCIMNGGLVFTGQLLTRLKFPLEVGYLHATRYGDMISGDRLDLHVPPPDKVAGRTVVLLDDILDEGITLKAISQLCLEMGAKELYTAVLLDKKHDHKVFQGYRADFTGLDIPDRFVFGYGLDYKGFWRNAPGIYAVRKP